VHSIRSRIFILFAAFTLFIGLSYSLLLLAYSWVVEDNVFNRIVSNEAYFIEAQFLKDGTITQPRAPFLQLYQGWDSLPADIYRAHLRDHDRVEFDKPDGGTLHLRPLTLGDRTLVLVADVSAFEVSGEYLPYVSILLGAVLLGISVISIAFAWPVATAATKPLLDHKEAVESNHVKTLKSGFADAFPNNEIGFLAGAIERSMLHIQKLLERESNFTRDVSHELRTPITILKNLSRHVRGNQRLSNEQAAQFHSAVAGLEQTTATLLALAREESQALQPVIFLNLLEDCILDHPRLAVAQDFELKITIPESTTVMANQHLLKLMVANLLSNALTHASRSYLEIAVSDGQILFRNPLETPAPLNPFENRSKGEDSEGLGLGLNLVERICTAMGWQVAATNEAGTFTVHLTYR
jgi:signal transduction histidine kinase